MTGKCLRGVWKFIFSLSPAVHGWALRIANPEGRFSVLWIWLKPVEKPDQSGCAGDSLLPPAVNGWAKGKVVQAVSVGRISKYSEN
jgi:hypothetical protein